MLYALCRPATNAEIFHLQLPLPAPLERELGRAAEQEASMSRRSGAPLSPNEETTLRRVAQGESPDSDHATSDVRRLAAFELIESVGGKYVLTGAGRRRVTRLPLTIDTACHDQAAYGEAGNALSQFYARSRRRG